MDTTDIYVHLYGPVPSRRLGFSLGVDIIPFKTCSLDCIYCQLGHSPKKTISRRAYIPASAVMAEIKKKLSTKTRIDYITFSGSGEPTLNTEIGRLIRELKKITDIPVAVLTNSTLLHLDEVRQALLPADLVIPSLDAATQEMFEKTNRPHPSLRIKDVLSGLKKFSQEFNGEIWIEILLVKGVNDTKAHLQKLKDIIDSLKPDRVQLNTVIRPPSEKFASALTLHELEGLRDFFEGNCEIIASFERASAPRHQTSQEESLLAMLRRRPMTLNDLVKSMGKPSKEVLNLIQLLKKKDKIKSVSFKGYKYYEPKG